MLFRNLAAQWLTDLKVRATGRTYGEAHHRVGVLSKKKDAADVA
jgi:hypothetical protein